MVNVIFHMNGNYQKLKLSLEIIIIIYLFQRIDKFMFVLSTCISIIITHLFADLKQT